MQTLPSVRPPFVERLPKNASKRVMVNKADMIPVAESWVLWRRARLSPPKAFGERREVRKWMTLTK
jgi:hypothetical protein